MCTTNFRNTWATWGAEINAEVISFSDECGDRDNAYYYLQLAQRLLKDIQLLPLWSCITRNQFGYGRVPLVHQLKENLIKLKIIC